jgi:hypothetical protein
MTRVVVAGALANKPGNGGEAWVRLSWVLGLARLGYETWFVEQIDPTRSIDGAGVPTAPDESANLAFFRAVCARFGIADRAALVTTDGRAIAGPAWDELCLVCDSADLLINISGHLTLPDLRQRFRRAIYLDIDPGFTQFWEAQGLLGAHLAGHDAFFTIGANIGRAACPIPDGGIRWRHTRPPVLLDAWPVTKVSPPWRFTTVGTWRGPYGPVEHDGITYGLKVHEFRRLLALPQQVPVPLEIALAIDPADARDRDALSRNGWCLADPHVVAADPDAFRRYVQGSGAEFSAAQGVYVATRSGWVSDRTVHYLASGKPALVQDTGYAEHYPVGAGLVPFGTLEEAIEGARRIARDYDAHCRAARAIAEEYFASDRVLGELMGALDYAP